MADKSKLEETLHGWNETTEKLNAKIDKLAAEIEKIKNPEAEVTTDET